ncbi:MAG: hypothetical protein ACM3Y9_16585 [Ignavibacteria bacterium]
MKKIFVAAVAAITMVLAAAPGFAADKAAATAAKAAPAAAAGKNYWDGWPVINKLGIFPECGVNVLSVGDDVLQATVDTYCGVKPGGYQVYLNPAMMDKYKKFKRGADKYPDGKLAVIVFKAGIAFTTEIKDGKPIMDAITVADGKSIATKDKGHPLNPETCFNCHETVQNGVCKKQGYLCADVSYRAQTN